jgi:hypothetical protein
MKTINFDNFDSCGAMHWIQGFCDRMSIAVLKTIRNDIADDSNDKASIELFDILGHNQKPMILNQNLDKYETMFSLFGHNDFLAVDGDGNYSLVAFRANM